MKPDGVTMETTEPTEAVVGTEPPSTQDAAVLAEEKGSAVSPGEDVQEAAASPPAGQEGTLAMDEAEVEPNDALKSKPTTSAAIGGGGGGAKTKTKAHAPQAALKTTGSLPKKPAAVAASSGRTQTGIADKKPAGSSRVSSAPAKVANGGEVPKRAPVGPVNGARPRTTGGGFLQGRTWPSLLIVYYLHHHDWKIYHKKVNNSVHHE